VSLADTTVGNIHFLSSNRGSKKTDTYIHK